MNKDSVTLLLGMMIISIIFRTIFNHFFSWEKTLKKVVDNAPLLNFRLNNLREGLVMSIIVFSLPKIGLYITNLVDPINTKTNIILWSIASPLMYVMAFFLLYCAFIKPFFELKNQLRTSTPKLIAKLLKFKQ